MQAYKSTAATHGRMQLAIVFRGFDGFCTNVLALEALFDPCPLDILLVIHVGQQRCETYSWTKIQAAFSRQRLIRAGANFEKKDPRDRTDLEKEDETYYVLLMKLARCAVATENIAASRRVLYQINRMRRIGDDAGSEDDSDGGFNDE